MFNYDMYCLAKTFFPNLLVNITENNPILYPSVLDFGFRYTEIYKAHLLNNLSVKNHF